jgi:hypothetical protein
LGSFIARQLSFMLETWAVQAMEVEGEEEVAVPMFNCVAAAGPNCAKLSDCVKPARRGMIDILPPWFTQHEDTSQVIDVDADFRKVSGRICLFR